MEYSCYTRRWHVRHGSNGGGDDLAMRILITVLAVAVVVLAIQYGQIWLTGSNPPPLLWAVVAVVLGFLAVRRITTRRSR